MYEVARWNQLAHVLLGCLIVTLAFKLISFLNELNMTKPYLDFIESAVKASLYPLMATFVFLTAFTLTFFTMFHKYYARLQRISDVILTLLGFTLGGYTKMKTDFQKNQLLQFMLCIYCLFVYFLCFLFIRSAIILAIKKTRVSLSITKFLNEGKVLPLRWKQLFATQPTKTETRVQHPRIKSVSSRELVAREKYKRCVELCDKWEKSIERLDSYIITLIENNYLRKVQIARAFAASHSADS